MPHPWIADRTRSFESSGIRRVFDLAAKLKDPINLSIGQPHFEVPEPVRRACIEAIESGKNGYALTQGMPVLREKLQAQLDDQYGHADRKVFISSGTSGGLVLAMLALVNPGDEVIFADPYFVMYPSLVKMVGGLPVMIDTYPTFQLTAAQIAEKITDRTKAIIFNSPANPTGVMADEAEQKAIAALAAERKVALISDEIYSRFCYDEPFVSPAQFNDETIVIDGFSKSHAVTGWRLGYVHGPAEVIDTMTKLQQFTFVCARSRRSGPARRRWMCRSMSRWPTIGPSATGSTTDYLMCMKSKSRAGRFTFSRRRRGAAARSLSTRRLRTTCSSSPATSSALATRTSAFPTRPATRRLTAGLRCCGGLRSREFALPAT